ncbi:permease [Paenibacillus antibioticophila]|uniref:Permease n=1 Tax=Paenibacillus antibioticophila TaxID=1274374 RepID=A0A919XZR1_9BACL|nr:sporulation integral membrane protein YtvI [Paenibacillus antibioticophila]GIO39350.1 permease [Paenibacillus antibioticophila]
MDHIMARRMMRGTWVALCIILLVGGLIWLLPILYPFLIAWLIAYLINPLVRWLQVSLRFPRWLAVTGALLIYAVSGGIVLAAAVTRMVKELLILAESLDGHLMRWKSWFVDWTQSEGIHNIINEINRFIANNPGYETTIHNNIDQTAQSVGSAITRILNGLLEGILQLLTSLPSMGILLVVILTAAFFISNQWTRNMAWLAKAVPERFRKSFREVWLDLQQALSGYFQAQLVLISVTAFIVLIGLLLLGVNSAFTYAILIGFVDLLPYLGVGTIMLPWLLYCFMTGDTSLAIGLAVLYGVIIIARQIIEPKILASSVGLDPLPTMISMFVGLKLFGFLGLVAGPAALILLGAMSRAGLLRDLRNYIMEGKLR